MSSPNPRTWLVITTALAAVTAPANAQDAPARLPDGTAAGFTVGAVVVEGGALGVGSFQLVALRANKIGYAFSIYVPVSGSGFVLFPAAGLTYNVSLKDANILFKAGPILVAGFAGDASVLSAGAQIGVGLIRRIGNRTGLLIDFTPQRFWGDGDRITLYAMSVGLVGLPERP